MKNIQKTKLKIQAKQAKLSRTQKQKGSGYLNEALKILNYQLLEEAALRQREQININIRANIEEEKARKAASDIEVANILSQVKAKRAEAQAKQLLLMQAIAENEALKKLSTLNRKGSVFLEPPPEKIASIQRRNFTNLPHHDINNPNNIMLNLFSTKPNNHLVKNNAHSKKTALSGLNKNKEKEVNTRTTKRTKKNPKYPYNPKQNIPRQKYVFNLKKNKRRRNP